MSQPYPPPHGPYRPQTQQHAAYPQQSWTPPPAPSPVARNGLGTAGLVLGIIAAVFAVIPLVGIIAWFIWPLGLIFAGIGFYRCQQHQATNRGVAIGGLATSGVAGVLCVLWLLFFGAYAASQPTPAAAGTTRTTGTTGTTAGTIAAAKPAGPLTTITDGTYQVGPDMAAGRYKTPGPSADAIIKDCYWQRTKDDSGQFTSIISNGNAVGPGSVTVKNGEFFQTSGGCTWTKQ